MIVVDCAALVDALTGVAGSEALRGALANDDMHAPSLLDFEVVSALRGLTLRGQLSSNRAQDALADFNALAIRRWPSGPALRARVFTLRHSLSAYDAAYVALAESLECPLVTRDSRLARAGGHEADIRVM